MMPTKNKKYVLGVDIGGTKIDAQLFEVQGSGLAETASWSLKQDTQKGQAAHFSQIAEVICAANAEAEKEGAALTGVGIASPGRFTAEGTIKPGTNQNLGNTPHEFDNASPKAGYTAALTEIAPALSNISLHVCNDGNAMLAGMLEGIQKGKADGLVDQNGNDVTKHGLRRKHVALFGIGTGVGHAIATVQDNGEFGFVTDGYASKLRVKVDDADLQLLLAAKARLEAKTGKEEVLMFEDNTVRAEDLFRGPVVNALAAVDNGHQIDLGSAEHNAALQFAGKYMARTIALIKSGESQDVEPANGWTAADKAEAAKTGMYLIGGGMGGSAIGKAITHFAAGELDALGINDVQLVQVTGENVAARAAANLVPESVYRGSAKMGY